MRSTSLRVVIIFLTLAAFLISALAGYTFDKNVLAFWVFAISSVIVGTIATVLSEKIIEEKIKESESRLRSLLEDSNKK